MYIYIQVMTESKTNHPNTEIKDTGHMIGIFIQAGEFRETMGERSYMSHINRAQTS